MKVAKERKSSVLASNAVHHRIDSLTSIVALVAIAGSHIFTGTTWLDPAGGLIVSMMVIKAGWGNTRSALLELADVGIDEEIKSSARKAATNALLELDPADGIIMDNNIHLRDIQGIKAGQNYLLDLEFVVPGSWSIQKAQRVEDQVRQKVGSSVRGVRRVKVRFVPEANSTSEFPDEFIGADVSPRDSPERDEKTRELQSPKYLKEHHND